MARTTLSACGTIVWCSTRSVLFAGSTRHRGEVSTSIRSGSSITCSHRPTGPTRSRSTVSRCRGVTAHRGRTTTYHPCGSPSVTRRRAVVVTKSCRHVPRWAAQAERAGFSTLATIGRHAYPGMSDIVALAAAAGATSGIGLMSELLLAPTWPGELLAKELAGIDGVSGHRVTLGLGVGGRPDDFVVPDHGMAGRGTRLDRNLETFRDVWAASPSAAVRTRRCRPVLDRSRCSSVASRPRRWRGWPGGARATSASGSRRRSSSRASTRLERPGRKPAATVDRGLSRSRTSRWATPIGAGPTSATTTPG